MNSENMKEFSHLIASWWDDDCAESIVKETILYLPKPYVTAGGSVGSFPRMYGWDTNFINMALVIHKRADLVANHIENSIYMINKYGFVLNANDSQLASRSQTPLLHESVRLYAEMPVNDRDLIIRAYEAMKKEYTTYWFHPSRCIDGYPTYIDTHDPKYPLETSSEAESGLDFTPLFDGNVTQCKTVLLCAILGRYAENMKYLATYLQKDSTECDYWTCEHERLCRLVHDCCWDQENGWFFTQKEGRFIPVWDISSALPLYAGLVTQEQADKIVANIDRFLQKGGLSQTDRVYDSPHAEFPVLQWQYPAGWAPMHILTVAGLVRYGYLSKAKDVAMRFTSLIYDIYSKTNSIFEKYNVCDYNIDVPNERYGNLPMHGWSAAACVILSDFIVNDSFLLQFP